MAVTWKRLNPERALAQGDAIAGIYREVFSALPFAQSETQVEQFRTSWQRSTLVPGFAFVAATAPHGEMVGFAYGWPSRPEDPLHASVGQDAFLLAELAVKPKYRGLGLCKILSDALLRSANQGSAYFITLASNSHAYRISHANSWERLASEIGEGKIAMGKRLPRRVNAF